MFSPIQPRGSVKSLSGFEGPEKSSVSSSPILEDLRETEVTRMGNSRIRNSKSPLPSLESFPLLELRVEGLLIEFFPVGSANSGPIGTGTLKPSLHSSFMGRIYTFDLL
jgi:hypothetical protein